MKDEEEINTGGNGRLKLYRGNEGTSKMERKWFILGKRFTVTVQSATNVDKGHIPQEITLADFLSGTPAQIKVHRGSSPREHNCL